MLVHRYLGIAVGLVMVAWCLSGFVMMYQGYPDLSESRRLSGLAPLDYSGCCASIELSDADAADLSGFRVEMLAGRPVAHLTGGEGARVVDLTTGQSFGPITSAVARDVAGRQGRALGVTGEPARVDVIDQDQWSIQQARRHRPVYRIRFDDAARTDIYVSGKTGQAFQHTDSRIRLLGWLGAVPHWLYPTILRQNGALWNDVVVWLSVAGTFLTATGLYVGVSHLKRRRNGRWSPFRGLWLWHHMIGLTFGVLTLTWVFSGLMTMNPWGLLEGGSQRDIRQALEGDVSSTRVAESLQQVMAQGSAGGAAQVSTASVGGRVWLVSQAADGQRIRLGPDGRSTPMNLAQLDALVAPLLPLSAGLMFEEDAYFYRRSKSEPLRLPVYRAILADDQATRLYLDAQTGEVRRIVDRDARISRWVRNGLHSLDFAGLRARPIWDLVVLPLLFGVTLVCGTGLWMSWRRAGRDLAGLKATLARLRGFGRVRRRREFSPERPASNLE